MNLDRRRTRGEFSTKTCTQRAVYTNGSQTYTNSNYREGYYEFIEDVYAPFGKGVWPMKPLFKGRVALSVTPAPLPCSSCYRTDATCYGEWIPSEVMTDLSAWEAPMSGDEYHPDTIQLPADVRSELAGRAEASLPHLYRRLPNLARSLAELKDMHATVRSVADTLRFLTGLRKPPSAALAATLGQCKRENVNFWRAARSFRVKEGTKGMVKVMAGDVLAWQFAIAPYVDDMRKLIKQSARVVDTFRQLQRGLGKVHTLKVWAERSSSSENEYGEVTRCARRCPGCPMSTLVDPVVPSYYQREITRLAQHGLLTLKYTYQMPPWAREIEKQAEALKKYMTAGINTKTVIELLPFEFVLEWFFNVDAALSGDPLGFNKDLTRDCTVDIVDACLTYVVEEGMTTSWGRFARGSVATAVGTRKLVYRWVGDQALDHLVWVFKLPNYVQFALGATMAVGSSHVYS